MEPAKPSQQIDPVSAEEGGLVELLKLREPILLDPNDAPHRQLNYIDEYARALGCNTFVIEQHYIDRDFMEEHSVFYSKDLSSSVNYCRRVHFFRNTKKELEAAFKRLHTLALSREDGTFDRECREFSEKNYIGFTVIKPLIGCPVGRTVLTPYPRDSAKGYVRRFPCACNYDVHLLGIPLYVRGLAFQQQDVGVSACATTALWTSLQRARQLELSGAAAPAQITLRASQFNLPFGRPMPSEGLSLDQMSMAINSLGYSPYLFKAESFEATRAVLFSAISSGISAVLVLEDETRTRYHAVAVSGMAVDSSGNLLTLNGGILDQSEGMRAIYLHDDRYGPYIKGIPIQRKGQFHLRLIIQNAVEGNREETWTLTHLLIPMHSKVRLSFGELNRASGELADYVQALRRTVLDVGGKTALVRSTRIFRSYKYIERLLSKPETNSVVQQICSKLPLPRYLATVRMEARDLDPIDVLLDTTATERNLSCIAVISHGNSRANTRTIAETIASAYHCELI
jgi:hypothetical protein